MEIILNGKASLAERFAEINVVHVREVFAEAPNVTQKYPKTMAQVLKIPHLLTRLLETPRIGLRLPRSNRLLRP
jgi:hypothetical protein